MINPLNNGLDTYIHTCIHSVYTFIIEIVYVHESFEKVSEPFLIHTHTHITYAGSLKMKVRKEGKEEAQMEVEDLRLV